MKTMIFLILATLLFGAPAVLIAAGSLAVIGAWLLTSSGVWLFFGMIAAIAIANKLIIAHRENNI
jgi:hypothetical protein